MLHAVPNLLMLALIYVVTRFIQRWVRLFYDAVREGRMSAPGIDAETAVPAQQLTTMFIWLLAVAIAYPFIPGSQGVAFKGVSVLLGLMLSLGSSNVVSQAASGYMLMFSKALRPGDFVRINEYEGVVMSLGVLSTKIRTPRDEEINVPNTLIVGSTMKNYTRLNKESGVPVVTTLTIGYDAPWRQVHALMLEAARRTKGLRANPEPRVLQAALSDFYVEYTLLARLEVIEGRAVVMSALHANLQDLFNEYGVQIMSPHFEGPPDYKVYVPKEKWYEAPATPEAETRTTPQGNEER
jgi:small-conductance mechanosensitive channel